MPLGHTHDRITLWTLPVITLGAGLWGGAVAALAIGGSYLFAGLMFAGDLDIYSRQYQRWLGLRWIWIPYRALMRHRSWWSHGPILGTLGRVCYLVLFLVALTVLGLGIATGLGWWRGTWLEVAVSGRDWLHHHREVIFTILLGLELGSLSHSVSDIGVSWWKRHQKSRRKGSLSSPPRQGQSRLAKSQGGGKNNSPAIRENR